MRQYEGTVEADRGQVDSAKLSLIYTRVTSPLTGRVGLRQVDPGNIVHAADTNGLVVITQVQPTTVVFAVPETRLTQIVPRLYAGGSLTVEAWDRDNKTKLATGVLFATDNQIDTTTGTVKLRAEFNNENYLLFPNEFVNARALIEVRHGATVIPPAAVQVGSSGSFVYVVQPDRTVVVRPVTPGPVDGNLMAIDNGLSPGDVVVIDGTDRLRDGIKVQTVARDAGAARRPLQAKAPRRMRLATVIAGRALGPISRAADEPVTPVHHAAGGDLAADGRAIFYRGIVAYRLLPVSALPEVDYPTIQVVTLYPGASPDVMTSSVTAPLETPVRPDARA